MSLAPKKSTPNFRHLQASFEPQQADTSNRTLHPIYPPPHHRSRAGDLAPSANMPSNNSRIASLTKTIDSVLDTPAPASRPASPPNRPLAKFRPSWIGPQPSKPNKADVAGHLQSSMKQRVSIDFASPGLQPPVYIFTSLSHPQWEPVEMFPVKQMNGEYTFVRNFDVDEGEYQYKFRLGPGDWWVCDEKKQVVDDGAGNRNNLVVVKASTKLIQDVDSGYVSAERCLVAPISPSGLMPKAARQSEPVFTPAVVERAIAPWKSKERVPSTDSVSQGQQTSEHGRAYPVADKYLEPPHEEDIEGDVEPYVAPLLRHESLSPTSREQDHAPLFRHESVGLGCSPREEAAHQLAADGPTPAPAVRPAPAARIMPREAAPNDPSLHHFPTDHEGIVNHIARTHTRLPEDETGEDIIVSSPASSDAISDSSSLPAVSALPSVNEGDNEQLEKIRELGEQEAEAKRESGEDLDPLREEDEAAEPEDADFEPRIPELKVVLVPKVEQSAKQIVVIDRTPSLAEKVGTRNLMAVAVGLFAVVTAVTLVKMFR